MNLQITPLQIRNDSHARCVMRALGVSGEGIRILSSKDLFLTFTIEGIRSWEANIIKQSLLSLGADAAIDRSALVKDIKTTALIFGTVSQLRALCAKLKHQPFGLKEVSTKLAAGLENVMCEKYRVTARNKILRVDKPVICGILNVTTDSFSGDGILSSVWKPVAVAVEKTAAMQAGGAKMIDIGAESGRPYATPVSEKEEIARLVPVLKAVRKKFKDLIISVDTYKYNVARAAVEEGADVINDITALRQAPKIAQLVSRYRLGCVLMHMKGSPKTMQVKPVYKKVTTEVIDFFQERLDFARTHGIAAGQLIIDPGIGFGKRLEDNLTLLNELYKFKMFGRPIFVGVSRKSFIGALTRSKVHERLSGSIAANIAAVVRGANILRVHDVKETDAALRVAESIFTH